MASDVGNVFDDVAQQIRPNWKGDFRLRCIVCSCPDCHPHCDGECETCCVGRGSCCFCDECLRTVDEENGDTHCSDCGIGKFTRARVSSSSEEEDSSSSEEEDEISGEATTSSSDAAAADGTVPTTGRRDGGGGGSKSE